MSKYIKRAIILMWALASIPTIPVTAVFFWVFMNYEKKTYLELLQEGYIYTVVAPWRDAS